MKKILIAIIALFVIAMPSCTKEVVPPAVDIPVDVSVEQDSLNIETFDTVFWGLHQRGNCLTREFDFIDSLLLADGTEFENYITYKVVGSYNVSLYYIDSMFILKPHSWGSAIYGECEQFVKQSETPYDSVYGSVGFSGNTIDVKSRGDWFTVDSRSDQYNTIYRILTGSLQPGSIFEREWQKLNPYRKYLLRIDRKNFSSEAGNVYVNPVDGRSYFDFSLTSVTEGVGENSMNFTFSDNDYKEIKEVLDLYVK